MHDRLLAACTAKFEDVGGTLALSITAYCGLAVDVAFAALYQ